MKDNFTILLVLGLATVVLSKAPCLDSQYECNCVCTAEAATCVIDGNKTCSSNRYYCESQKKCIGLLEMCDTKCYFPNTWMFCENENMCFPQEDVWKCDDKYTTMMTPCHDKCPEGLVKTVNNQCHHPDKFAWKCDGDYHTDKWPCKDGKCQALTIPCDGKCPFEYRPCGSDANMQCFKANQFCNNPAAGQTECGEGFIRCGNECKSKSDQHLCGKDCKPFSEPCDDKTCSENAWLCTNTHCKDGAMANYTVCLSHETPCEGQCPDNNFWRCKDFCFKKERPCDGACPEGYKMKDGICNGAMALSASLAMILLAIAPTLLKFI